MKNDVRDFADGFWLDELVAGNLQGDQYRKALQALDAQPQRWRDCALAFLEEQALAQELQALAQGNVGWSDAADVDMSSLSQEPARGFSLASPLDDTRAALPGSHVSATSELRQASRMRWMQRLTSLAALLLISFTIGWVGSDFLDGSGAATAEPTGNLAGNSGSGPFREPASGGDIQSGIGPSNLLTDFHLAGERFVPIDREVPEELREMERRGMIRIETSDAFLPMDLGNGSSAIVPVQQYRVTPVIYTY